MSENKVKNLIDDVKYMQSKHDEHCDYQETRYMLDDQISEIMHENRSKILKVLGGFQIGDTEILELFLDYLGHFKQDGHLKDKTGITTKQGIDCLKRLKEVAQLMEGP
jgi:hypothetical protein